MPGQSTRSNSGFDRFFSQGMKDAARRFPPLAEPAPDDEQPAIAVLESSAAVRVLDRAITVASRAIETSAGLDVARRAWDAVDPIDRTLLGGIALSVAAVVHAGLVAWHERPAGWLWLMLPGLALGVGLVTTVFAGAARRKTG